MQILMLRCFAAGKASTLRGSLREAPQVEE